MQPIIQSDFVLYVIETPNELVQLVDVYNEYKDKPGLVFIANDIDLNGSVYVPVGDLDSPFKWDIDGAMNLVSNFKVEAYNKHFGGLIGYAKCKIKNLRISSATVEARSYAGALVGFADSCEIENIAIEKVNISSRLFTGALVGGSSASSIKRVKLDMTESIVYSTSQKASLLVSQIGLGSEVSDVEVVTNGIQSVKLFSNVLNSINPPRFSNIVIKTEVE